MGNPYSPFLSVFSWSSMIFFFFTLIIGLFQEQVQDCLQSPLLFMNKYLDGKFLCVFLCGGVSSEGLMLLTTMCILAHSILTGTGYRHYHCLGTLKFTFSRFLYLCQCQSQSNYLSLPKLRMSLPNSDSSYFFSAHLQVHLPAQKRGIFFIVVNCTRRNLPL